MWWLSSVKFPWFLTLHCPKGEVTISITSFYTASTSIANFLDAFHHCSLLVLLILDLWNQRSHVIPSVATATVDAGAGAGAGEEGGAAAGVCRSTPPYRIHSRHLRHGAAHGCTPSSSSSTSGGPEGGFGPSYEPYKFSCLTLCLHTSSSHDTVSWKF